jgi:PAS domain-containing protein
LEPNGLLLFRLSLEVTNFWPTENDFPFALLYSLQTDAKDKPKTFSIRDAVNTGEARLESFLGVLLDPDGRPAVHEAFMNDAEFVSTFARVCASGQPALFDLEHRTDLKSLIMEDPPTRGFGDEPRVAVLAPIEPTTRKGVNAVIVMGINPRRPYDSEYELFVRGLARSISSALASVQLVIEQQSLIGRAREMEQRALAMIDVSPVGSFLMGMDGELLYVNQTWLDITGTSQSQATKGPTSEECFCGDLVDDHKPQASIDCFRFLAILS